MRSLLRVESNDPPGPRVHHQSGDPKSGRSKAQLADGRGAQLDSRVPACDECGGDGHDCRAVDVVAHHRLRETLDQTPLDLEALRSRDVLQVVAPNVGAIRTTVSTNSSVSSVSIKTGIAEMPANCR